MTTTSDIDQTGETPRHTPVVRGHQAAEQAFLSAYNSRRLHHAWLLSGPRGVGKATLAYRVARFLVSRDGGAADSLFAEEVHAQCDRLDVDVDSPVFQRIAAGGHGNLRVLERLFDDKRQALQPEIGIDQVRALHGFFSQTSAEGGWRVAIVDAADEMNRHAANALLKVLEEPPRQSILLLISHAPGKIPATIRSRCRQLRLSPLSEEEVLAILEERRPALSENEARSLSRLSMGAPGRALMLADTGGLELYQRLFNLLEGLPNLDIPAVHRMAQELAAPKADNQYRLFVKFLSDWITRFAHSAAGATPGSNVTAGEQELVRRIANDAGDLDRWIELWEKVNRLVARADTVHLDRKQVVIALLGDLESMVRKA